jgi:FMN-dependent NADH-azoreductase
MQLLHIDSSILGAYSASRQLSGEIVKAELARTPAMKVIYRDLAAEPLQHISSLHLALAQGKSVDVPEAVRLDAARGNAALEEFLASQIVVIGAPMYNFTVPTQLKAWIDRLCVAGKTFKYASDGVKGLAGGKKVIIASSRGGSYQAGSPTAFLDHQEAYLTAIFNFFGITDIQFVRAEGLARTDHRAKSLADATSSIANLIL